MNDYFKNLTRAALAPMAGAADSAFRDVCMDAGAAFCVSEMVSAKALTLGDKKTPLLLAHGTNERPFGAQLFGCEPKVMAEAARIIERDFAPDFIDINMGCPAPKITGSGAGSALMKDIPLAACVVSAVCAAVALPVTVKMRAGWDSVTASAHALAMQDAGASGLTVHPRTRAQMFSGAADLAVLREVKQTVAIPVVGNGDIRCAADAVRMLDETGCDMVMVGRGALGNPFIFSEINAALCEKPYQSPPLTQRLAVLRAQLDAMRDQKGDHIATLEARKHIMWYLKGFRGAAGLRVRASTIDSFAGIDKLLAEAAELDGQKE